MPLPPQDLTTERGAEPGGGWSHWSRYARRLLIAGLAAYWAVLFVLTHIPAPARDLGVNDKLLHLVAYGVLGFLFAWVISPTQRRLATWLVVVLVCSSYGAVDELLQRQIPSRTADINDFFADVVGAALGASILLLAQGLWRWFAARRVSP